MKDLDITFREGIMMYVDEDLGKQTTPVAFASIACLTERVATPFVPNWIIEAELEAIK